MDDSKIQEFCYSIEKNTLFKFPGAPYGIFLLFLPWLPCDYCLDVVITREASGLYCNINLIILAKLWHDTAAICWKKKGWGYLVLELTTLTYVDAAGRPLYWLDHRHPDDCSRIHDTVGTFHRLPIIQYRCGIPIYIYISKITEIAEKKLSKWK